MNNFKGGGGGFKKGGSKSKFEGKKKFGNDKKHGGGKGRDSRTTGPAAQLFAATCSECGKKCDVPFKPSHDKPVYCSNCFGIKKNANEPRGNDSRNERPDFKQLPREERPARHNASRGRGDDGIADLKRQISGLELKLNRILEIVNPPMPSKKVPLPVKEVSAPVVAKKAVAKKAPAKKVAAKAPVKKAAAKAPAKKAVVKKVAAKAPAKKVAAKAPAKKAVVKKVVAKKAAAKTPAKKAVAKKAPAKKAKK